MTDQAQPEQPVAWAELASGPASPASFTALTEADATALSGAHLVDAIVCSEKVASLALGLQTRLMAALAVPFVAGDPMRLAGKLARRSGLTGGDDYQCNVQMMVPEAAVSLAAGELAAALRIAPVTASHRVREAVHLTEEFTPARQALEAGTIDRGKLRVLLEHIQVLPTDQVGPVLDQVLPEAADRCTSEIREIATQAVITANPEAAADRHRQAAARREVKVTPGTDAMATLKAFLPADGAVKIFQVSDLLATGTAGLPDDPRGIGARRADALVDLADRLLTDGCIDLTGYLGQPLPDHSPTHPTPRRRGTGTGTGTGCPADAHEPTRPVDARPAGTGTAGPTEPRGTDSSSTPAVGVPTTESTRPVEPADPHGAPSTDAHPTPTPGQAADHTAADRAVTGTDFPSGHPIGTTAAADHAAAAANTVAVAVEPNSTGQVDTAAPDSPAPDSPAPAEDAADRRTGRVLSRQGRRPHLTVTMSLDTLTGQTDLPGLLAGFGPIPADLARGIAASAGTITAAITDPATGAVTTSGELTYRPRQALRDKVGVRTDTCQFPSCRQPAWRCDFDHRDPFNHQHPGQGGRTVDPNMTPLCRRHHLMKDHADWRVHVDTSQLIINWTSPTGHTYRRRPRQTAPPEAWIRTAGTTIAEQLDHIATISACTTPTSRAATIAQHQADPNQSETDTADPADQRTGATAAADDGAPTDGDTATDNAGPTGNDTGAPQAVPDPGQTSRLEDRLTDALLRHCLANPPLTEYVPDPDAASDQAATPTNDPNPGPTRGTEHDADEADDLDDDPPPF